MLPNRKRIAASAGLLMVAATAIVGASQSASPATSIPVPVARQQAGKPISIIPGAIAPGGTVQKSNAAKWAVVVKYGAAKAGIVTKLQKKSGSSWRTLKKGKVDKKGYALFAVPPALASQPVTYRIDGPGVPSQSASTSMWGSSADFADEFGGTTLGSNWAHRGAGVYSPESRRTCAKTDARAVKIKDGSARLSLMLDPDRKGEICAPEKPGKPGVIFGKFGYRLQANIGTQGKKSFLYGVAAARIKFNALQGQHASFWLQPDNQLLDTTLGQEVDIIEWFGRDMPNGGLTSFVYAPSRGGKKTNFGNGGWIKNPNQYLMNSRDRWWKKYHVFSVEWTPDYYVFRIDGKETGRIVKSQLDLAADMTASTPEYPILSILASDYELGKLPKRDEKNNLPQTMSVDWMKVWQDKDFIIPVP